MYFLLILNFLFKIIFNKKKYKSHYEELLIDQYDLKLLETNKKIFKNKKNKKKILVEITSDYGYFYLIRILKHKIFNNHDFYGFWPYFIKFNDFEKNILTKFNRYIYDKIKIFKWFNYWKSIHVEIQPTNHKIKFNEKKIILISKKIFNKLKNKEDVVNISYNGILIGDLIYDTFLRFGNSPTISNIKDSYLYYLIHASIRKIEEFRYFEIEKKFQFYLTQYSSYIQNGIIVRYFAKYNIPCYSCNYFVGTNFLQKLKSKNFYNHNKIYTNFLDEFKKQKDKNYLLNTSRIMLKKKFSGQRDYSSFNLKKKGYSKNKLIQKKFKKNNYNGILFLHDFYDAPHDFIIKLFPDFYDWAIFTLDVIKKYNLKIAVKPHPNQTNESKLVIKNLKKKYNTLSWIDENYSNQILFKNSKLKFGVSFAGSVLYELVYNNIYPLYLAPNSISNLNIYKIPISRKKYMYDLINAQNYELSRNYKKDIEKIYSSYYLISENNFNVNDIRNINKLRYLGNYIDAKKLKSFEKYFF